MVIHFRVLIICNISTTQGFTNHKQCSNNDGHSKELHIANRSSAVNNNLVVDAAQQPRVKSC